LTFKLGVGTIRFAGVFWMVARGRFGADVRGVSSQRLENNQYGALKPSQQEEDFDATRPARFARIAR
jgi:hypothetical protein